MHPEIIGTDRRFFHFALPFLFAIAIGTAFPCRPRIYGSLPLMSALSQPPRLLIGLSGNLHRAKPTVLRGMPFGGQTWIHRDEVVNAFDDMSL